MDFHEIWHWGVVLKFVSVTHKMFLGVKNVLKKVVEKNEMSIICPIYFFHSFYDFRDKQKRIFNLYHLIQFFKFA
jgi:hypothetical protein